MIGTPEQVNVDLTRHQEAVARNADLLVKGFCQSLFNEIQSGGRFSPGTPVDTGFARANWHGGIGGAGAASLQEVALSAKAGDVVEASNNAPYIARLEFGFIGTDAGGRYFPGFGPKSVGGRSSQAPDGFIRLALLHSQDLVDEVADHVMTMP